MLFRSRRYTRARAPTRRFPLFSTVTVSGNVSPDFAVAGAALTAVGASFAFGFAPPATPGSGHARTAASIGTRTKRFNRACFRTRLTLPLTLFQIAARSQPTGR